MPKVIPQLMPKAMPKLMPKVSLFFATAFSLICFASNSILCRLALANKAIDPTSFTLIRIISGMITLLAIIALLHLIQKSKTKSQHVTNEKERSTWTAGITLFVYAILFSFAYIELDTATGALILFGAIQLTMVVANFYYGYGINKGEAIGAIVAFSGLVYLMLPSAETPSFTAFVLMFIAGISTAIYTLCGRRTSDALRNAGFSFVKAAPFAILFVPFAFEYINFSSAGIWLAVTSGAVTSGIGYFIWYSAVPKLTVMQSSVLTLLVPIIAALGGVIFSNEIISSRLVIATVIIFTGIFMVISSKNRPVPIKT